MVTLIKEQDSSQVHNLVVNHTLNTNGSANGHTHFTWDHYPPNVGILAIEVYFPSVYVDQTELEKFDGVSSGKYTIGLGQNRMAFVDDREDINSMCLTVVQSLMEKYAIPYDKIGRLEVGTETIIDKSKSVKSVLMQLFAESGATDIEGIDTINACYGGTNAVFNAINWIESSSWDGRLALVVAGDIAIYAPGNARPTGGAGCVAMLLGKDAPLVIERGLRSTHMEHAWDFYKPILSSEFPEVDGKLSVICYIRALDICYARYVKKWEKKEGKAMRLSDFDYVIFHSPYTKLVQKSYARLMFNDFLRYPDDPKYKNVQQFRDSTLEGTYMDKEVEQAFVALSKDDFETRVAPSLLLAKELGNIYCGSVYACLSSLVCNEQQSSMNHWIGSRIGVFSYGSGLAASLFSLRIQSTTRLIHSKLDLKARLTSRIRIEPQGFEAAMKLREETYHLHDYKPSGTISNMFKGTWYLDYIDAKFRRSYTRISVATSLSTPSP
jgi:hydroxymethylglutaryl-CoA synthase